MRQDLEQRFETESKTLPALQERVRAEAARWVFSRDEIWSYWDLRRQGSDESILQGPEGALHACAYDQADRPILLQQFDYKTEFVIPGGQSPNGRPYMRKVPTEGLLVEEFIVHRGDMLDVARFVRGELRQVYRLQFVDRLLVECESWERDFYGRTRFEYEGRRKKLAQSLADNGRVTDETVFGPHGQQTFYRVRRDGTRFQLGQPLPKGVTVTALKEAIRRRLLAQVPAVVAKSGIAEPIYCVVLGYDDEGNDALPPAIGIGLESERRRWMEEHGMNAGDFVWNPAEFTFFEKACTQFHEDDELEEACDLLNTELASRHSTAPAIRLLLEVATELNKIPWPPEVQRTPDFIVYAVDFEMGSLRKNLKAIATPGQIATLKARKLI